eukprot:SAG22_NODE_2751_length_2250_cov_31.785681_2_plen_345_part_00
MVDLRWQGFDGFPDFGADEHQQYIGDCMLAIVGTESSLGGTERRMVFTHNGKFRSIDSREMSFKLCCAHDENAECQTERENVRGFAVIHLEKQLIGIVSERISKTKISKSHGDSQKCKLWLYICLPIFIMVLIPLVPFIIGTGIGLFFVLVSWLVMMCCVGLLKMCFAPKTVAFSADAADDNEELHQLIVQETEYKNDMHRGGSLSPTQQNAEWEAKLFQSNYRALAICVLDPYHDKAREVIAVLKPEVRESEVVRFVMMADASKLKKPSEDLQNIRFVGGNRKLRNAARFSQPSAASYVGNLFQGPDSDGNACDVGSMVVPVLASCACPCCIPCICAFAHARK